MTTETGLHPLAQDYLARLSAEARRLPPDQARDLVADIGEHLAAGLGAAPSEADVRNMLDRLGTPAEVVEAAGPAPAAFPPVVQVAPGGIGTLEVGAVVALFVAEVLSILIPVAAAVWVVGLVLLLVSGAWSGREKLRGFLSLGTGFPLVLALLVLAPVTARTTVCAETATAVPSTGSGSAAVDVSCTSSGAPAWIGLVILGLALAYLVWQIRTAYVLLSRRRRA